MAAADGVNDGCAACAASSPNVSEDRASRLWKSCDVLSTDWTNRCGNVDKRKIRKMRHTCSRASCVQPGQVLLSPLRRVRDVSRSKPRAKAVGGSRKSAGGVDGSETGSTNETASLGRLFHFPRTPSRGDGGLAL